MSARLIVKKGPKKGLEIDLEKRPKWVIGTNSEECDLVLEDTSLPDKLAIIEKTPSGYVIRNLSKDGSFTVNGEITEDTHLLQEKDTLTLGSTSFTFTEQEAKKSEFDAIFDTPPEEEPDILSQDIQSAEEEIIPEPLEEEVLETEEEEDKEAYGKTAYDTIFEDSDDMENLPFNLIGETPLLLKVIGGPNTGAEIAIQKNCSYIIGKDPNSCDIVFQDVSVSRNHARLSVGEDGKIEVEDLGSKNGTFIDGAPLEGKALVTLQNVIQMGTTTFIVIDREASSETIYSPFAEKASEEVAAEEMEEVEDKEPEKVSWKEQIIPKAHLIIAAASILILFSVLLSFFSLFKSEPLASSEKKAKDIIAKVLKKYEDVQFSYTPSSGKLFLVGHVLSTVDHQELLYNIDQMSHVQSVEDNVVIDELVWKNVNDILTENGEFKSVMVHSPKAGTFVVTGYVAEEKDKQDLKDYLNINFPYLDRLQNEVVVETVLQEEIASLFLQKGFSGITFQLTDGDLVVGGRFDAKKKSQFQDLVDSMKSLTGIHQVKNIAIASDAIASSINVTDKYQVTGFVIKDQQDYNVVINGKILAIGENLDGMRLTQIFPNAILLEKDGIHYRIDYTR